MPFTHFRGGIKPPLPCNCRFTVNGFTLNGFTLNRFTVNGFIPAVDGLRHGRSRKPFTICSCEKCARNSPAICTYKTKDLNSLGINTYKKQGVGAPPSWPPCFSVSLSLSTTRCTMSGKVHCILGLASDAATR